MGTAFVIPALLFVLSTLVVTGVYHEPIKGRSIGASTEMSSLPRPMYWLANVIFYRDGEEAGWAGFASLAGADAGSSRVARTDGRLGGLASSSLYVQRGCSRTLDWRGCSVG
jgi:hypothetical protein